MIENKTILVFGDDWKRHPSSSQMLIKELSQTNRIVWVNSIGMRPPKLRMSDFKRILNKVKAIFNKKSPPMMSNDKDDTVEVIDPQFLPFHHIKLVQKINRFFIHKQISQKIASFDNMIVWVSNPAANFLCDNLSYDKLIYYCGDNFLAFEGIVRPFLEQAEIALLKRADQCLFSSYSHMKNLEKHITNSVHYLPHGVDNTSFIKANKNGARPDSLKEIKGPIVGYYGIFKEWIDIDLVFSLAKKSPEINYVLIGTPNSELLNKKPLPNVHLLGRITHDELAATAVYFDVAILIYKNTEMTRAINPLKLLEYFSLGLPVVSSMDFAHTPGFENVLVSNGVDDFLEKIHKSLDQTESFKSSLKQLSFDHSWSSRAQSITLV